MKKMMAAAVCLMAAMVFAAADGVCPTKVLKASDFKEMEKIDLTDITKMPIGLNLEDMGRYKLSGATSETCELYVPAALSAGGKQALRVTSLLVNSKTRVIEGAMSRCNFRNYEEGHFAITNDIFTVVCGKKDARYLPLHVDTKRRTGRIVFFWPLADKRIMELETQFIIIKGGVMMMNSLLHIQGDGLSVAPVKP